MGSGDMLAKDNLLDTDTTIGFENMFNVIYNVVDMEHRIIAMEKTVIIKRCQTQTKQQRI